MTDGEPPLTDGFRFLTGLVGLVAFLFVVDVELRELLPILVAHDHPPNSLLIRTIGLLGWIVIVAAPAGWGGLIYACWIRSGRITEIALAFVLALGVCGMAISLHGLAGGQYAFPRKEITMATVFFTGTWILSGLGIAWVVDWVRRTMVAANTDAVDATR